MMSNRESTKTEQPDTQPPSHVGGDGRSTTKWMIAVVLGALACVATAAYVLHWKQKDNSAGDSIETAAVSITPEAESSDPAKEVESESVPNMATVDVNEQIASFKQLELDLAQRLHDQFPNCSEPLILLGNVYRDRGNSSEAIRYWEQALQFSSPRSDVYEGMAMIAMEKGQYSEAVDFWRKALELNPQAYGLRSSIAQALMRSGKYDEAMNELQQQIEMYPASQTAHFLAGQILLQKKDYERAREEYLKVLELDPGHTNSYYGLFTVCARLREKDKAQEYREQFNRFKVRDMQKLIDDNKLVNDLVSARHGYAETAFTAAQFHEQYGQVAEAVLLLSKAAQASNNDPDILIRVAQWHHRQGRIAESLALHERIAKAYPENGLNSYLLGALYARVKRFDDARASFMRSIEYSPESSDACRELARLQLHTRTDIQQAKILAEKAVSLSPIAANYFVLSRACDTNGDRQGAVSALEKAIELEPNNQEYRRIYDVIANREQ